MLSLNNKNLQRLLFYSFFIVLGFIFFQQYFFYKNIAEQKSIIIQNIKPMLMIGFQGKAIADKDFQQTKELIEKKLIHGLIFFNRNIIDKHQLQDFIMDIRSLDNGDDLIIAIDEEGGTVSRLAQVKGVVAIPSAKDISEKYSLHNARQFFLQRAIFLRCLGFDVNFAPVVDLAINKDNQVILQNKRSFSSSANIVTKFAEVFIRAHKTNGIMTVIKHYPGHGSSYSDSHLKFTDITDTYLEIEEIPYLVLINRGLVDGVMVGHLFNKNIDNDYPASLSEKHISENLRTRLGFKGLVFTDDLQMGAISKYYNYEEATRLAIDSGNNVLIFAHFHLLNKKQQENIIRQFMKN
jgi:beta-N-acetylhexosaminidase